eukprot:2418298-Amphidinium_carterae.1
MVGKDPPKKWCHTGACDTTSGSPWTFPGVAFSTDRVSLQAKSNLRASSCFLGCFGLGFSGVNTR